MDDFVEALKAIVIQLWVTNSLLAKMVLNQKYPSVPELEYQL